MELQHPWLKILLTPIDHTLVTTAVNDENSDWAYVDSEIAKLGTISHSQVDIGKVQHAALTLLETQTKDMRLVTHLLRTLQHSGDEQTLLLAAILFKEYVTHYWDSAYPDTKIKTRLALQILKRFTSHTEKLATLDETSFTQIIQIFATLSTFWDTQTPALSKAIDELKHNLIQKRQNQSENLPEPPNVSTEKEKTETLTTAHFTAPVEHITIDDSSERAWKKSLQKVIDVLFENFPDRPIAYRLRRNVLWGTLDGVLIVDNNGVTPLVVPISQDKLSDYVSALPNATLAVLKQVEESVTKSPYWFEGHYLAASMATTLGFNDVASAIKEELTQLLTRLPMLKTYRFSDNTPFLSENVHQWLENTVASTSTTFDHSVIWQCFEEQGLDAALRLLNNQEHHEIRTQFYQQKLEAQLFEKAGLTQLAAQRWQQIEQLAQTLTVAEWETSFFKH